eukprot:06133_3
MCVMCITNHIIYYFLNMMFPRISDFISMCPSCFYVAQMTLLVVPKYLMVDRIHLSSTALQDCHRMITLPYILCRCVWLCDTFWPLEDRCTPYCPVLGSVISAYIRFAPAYANTRTPQRIVILSKTLTPCCLSLLQVAATP